MKEDKRFKDVTRSVSFRLRMTRPQRDLVERLRKDGETATDLIVRLLLEKARRKKLGQDALVRTIELDLMREGRNVP